jgi:hypothetical protein
MMRVVKAGGQGTSLKMNFRRLKTSSFRLGHRVYYRVSKLPVPSIHSRLHVDTSKQAKHTRKFKQVQAQSGRAEVDIVSRGRFLQGTRHSRQILGSYCVRYP